MKSCPISALMPCLALLFSVMSPDPVAGQADESSAASVELNEYERAFAKLMTGSQLVGHFTRDDQPMDQPLREDGYDIVAASKVKDARWRIEARIGYSGRDIVLPLLLEVHWADDTPVMSVKDLTIPGMGVFQARILFHGGQYAGTWSAGDHGGKMFGRVVRAGGQDDQNVDSAPNDDDIRARAESFWPQFRGYASRGISNGPPAPIEWNIETGENVRWKTPIPGLAHSSPVIWGDRLIVTSAESARGESPLKVGLYGAGEPVEDEGVHRFNVYCLDRSSGDVRWQRVAYEGVPEVKRHPKSSHANSTPVTDGRYVVAFFGSEGLFCYDMHGELKWSKDFGVLNAGAPGLPDYEWGFASSPIIYEDAVIILCDVQDQSFLTALNIDDGSEIWRTERDEQPTWGTPAIDVRVGREQVVVNGYRHIGGYDLRTGTELWKMHGGGDVPVPTPVVSNDLIFITSAHGRQAPIYAIHPLVEGEISDYPEDGFMAWSTSKYGNYMQTPLIYDDLLYACRDNGILSCHDARSGELIYRERVGNGQSGFSASCVANQGRIYITGEEGDVHILKAGRTFDIVHTNTMDETCMATPAIVDGNIYFRTRGHVVAVGSGSR